jgi:hypothetical protein
MWKSLVNGSPVQKYFYSFKVVGSLFQVLLDVSVDVWKFWQFFEMLVQEIGVGSQWNKEPTQNHSQWSTQVQNLPAWNLPLQILERVIILQSWDSPISAFKVSFHSWCIPDFIRHQGCRKYWYIFITMYGRSVKL